MKLLRSKTPNTPMWWKKTPDLLEWDFVLFFIVLHCTRDHAHKAVVAGVAGGRRRENERRATPKQAAKGSKQSCVSRTPLSCQVLAPSRAVARSVRGRRKTTLPRARWGPGLRASCSIPSMAEGAGRPGSTMQWSVLRPLHCRAEDRESHLPGAVALLVVSIFLGTTCARSLLQDLFGPLVSGSSRTTCRRSLYQDAFGPLGGRIL